MSSDSSDEYEVSSEPSSTTVTGPDDGNPEAAPRKKVYQEPVRKKRQKSYPIPCIVLLEFILPICYVINSMTTEGVMGMINIIILVANVAITNLTKKSITGHKIILSIELVYNIILLGLASSIGMREDEDTNIVKIMGLDFNNYVASNARLTIGISVVAIILEIVSAVLLFKTKPEIMLERRAKIYSSMAWIFASDFIWTFCLAVMGAVQMFMEIVEVSYCFLPLLAYILYISITMGIFGRPFVHQYILIVIYVYAIIFSLFIFYTTSPLGQLYPIIGKKSSAKIHSSSYFKKYAPLSLAVNVVQIWFSVQLCFVFKRSKPTIPHSLVTLSDILLVFSFVAVLVYSVFFPCYIAGVWELIVYLACFFSLNASRKIFFRLLSVIHNVLFSAIYVTCLNLFYSAEKANTNHPKLFSRILQPIGLYHFYNKSTDSENKHREFMFVLLGFLLTSILAQIGRVVHFKPPKETEGEQEEGMELRDIIDHPKKKKEKGPFAKFIIKIAKIVTNVVVFIFKNLSVGAVVVLGITFGYQENQYCFNAICGIILITNVLGLFHRPIFYFILFLTGLIIITATIFETMPTDYFSSTVLDYLEKTGLKRADGEADLPTYLWPYIVMVFLCVLITHMGKVKVIYPSTVVMFIFWALAILHLAYLYVYGPNIFSVIYVITGIFIFYSKVLNKVLLTKIAIVVSGISVSLHLTMLLFSEFEWTRNYLMSITFNKKFTMQDLIDLRTPQTPGLEAALLAVTMFCISLTYMNTNPLQKRPNIWVQGIREEFKAALRSLFFYISWLLMFFFSISNDYPTIIKCVISIFFLLGSKMARFFNKMVGALLYTNTVYIVIEVFLDVFPKLTDKDQNPYTSTRKWCEYIGLYFVDGDKGQGDRNYSMTWQLLFILVIIVNMIAEHPEQTDPKFDSSLGMRLYRAFYMMLHNWLPVFVNISLCISTLYNPTVFGFFSLLVLIIVQFKPKVLQRGAVWISVLFNFCFLFQYVIWLGPPSRFYFISNALDNDWGDFLSLRNIETEALLTNMVTAFMLTFYLQFRELAMNYDAGFNDLPEFLKGVIKFIVSNIFEIIEAVAIAISIFIPTFDGLFFTILISILFYMTLLHDFDNHKTISIHLWGLFLVIAGRLLSRIPYFSTKGYAHYVQEAFGLPFRGKSSTEYLWIILFALESLVIHIMETPMFQECRKDSIQRLAYRFIRVRQLKVISRLNQEVVDSIQHSKIEQIFRIADQSSAGLNRSASFLMPQQQQKKPEKEDTRTEEQKQKDEEEEIRRKAEEEERKRKEAEEKQRILEEKKAKAAAEGKEYIPEEEEEEEEPPKTIKDRILGFWDIFLENIVFPICSHTIIFYAKTVNLSCEAGVNVLTFNSLNAILRRIAASLTAGGVYQLTPIEQNFLKKLPPSFYMQLGGIGEIMQFPEIKREQYRELLLRYLGYTIRKLSLPCLVLMSIIYTYVKPYLLSFLFTIYIFAVFIGTNIYATPLVYRIFYIALIVMLLLRAVCTVDLIAEQMDKYLNSVSAAQSRISYPDLFGFNSADSSTIEILMFLVGTWYVVDNLRNACVFAPSHYNNKIFGGDNKLEGYPDKYFYNFDNPDKVLGLSQKKMPSIWQQIVQNANNIRIPTSNEYFIVMIIDAIAFLVMIFNISSWTTDTSSDKTTSGISIFFVFSLIFSAVFIFVFFLLRISNNFLYLYIFNTVQLICVLIFDFWVCYKPKASSLQFYLFLKYISILIVYHDTYLGKIIANFSFPDIENNWRKILYMNNFMRICPFVFEIHSLLMWMSKDTRVEFSHFFIQEDIKTLLENQMVYNHRPEQRKLERNLCIGGCFLFLIILLLFGPLFFMVGGSGAYMNNPILSSELEIGFTAVGAIYRSYAQFQNLTSSEHNDLANSGFADLSVLKTYSRDDLIVALFPLSSQSTAVATDNSIKSFLTNSNLNKRPYVKLTTTFQYPATTAKSNVISYQLNMDPITITQSSDYLEAWKNISSYTNLTQVPVVYFNPREGAASSSSTNYSCGFQFDTTANVVQLATVNPNISILEDATFLKIIIWSDEVESDGTVGTLVSMGGGIIGIYILIIFTFGEVLRERTLGGYDELWLERMRKPENLYQYIIAIEAFRSVGAIDREYMMMEMFLDVVRSKEACIALTNEPESEEPSTK